MKYIHWVRNHRTTSRTHLGIVMHREFGSCFATACSNSSRAPCLLSFLTRDLTAFSPQRSSVSPFRYAKSFLTIGCWNAFAMIEAIATRCRASFLDFYSLNKNRGSNEVVIRRNDQSFRFHSAAMPTHAGQFPASQDSRKPRTRFPALPWEVSEEPPADVTGLGDEVPAIQEESTQK